MSRVVLFSFASSKNELGNSYFKGCENVQKMIKTDSWVCFYLTYYFPHLVTCKSSISGFSDKVSAFQRELDTEMHMPYFSSDLHLKPVLRLT